jgi:pimeloyl-ACP methyl ester carboxylesterase
MLGHFVDEKAQHRYRAAYDAAQRWWPDIPTEKLDVETRFGRTRVRRCGARTGTPLVLLHGIFGTSLSWYPHVADLAEHHPIHAVDTIDEPGGSVGTRPVTTIDDLADWLADVLAGLDLDGAHLAGISRGGWLALVLATRTSDRLAGVTAIDPSGLGEAGARFLWWSAVHALTWFLPAPILRRIARGDVELRRAMRPLLFSAVRGWRWAPPQHLFTDDELRAVAVPVHLVLAERSVILDAPAVADRVRSLNPLISVEVVAGAGHAVSLEQPRLVTDRILASAG